MSSLSHKIIYNIYICLFFVSLSLWQQTSICSANTQSNKERDNTSYITNISSHQYHINRRHNTTHILSNYTIPI